jgi:signal transduction histidine kinase
MLGFGLSYWLLLGNRINDIDTESSLLAEIILEATVFGSADQVRIPAVVENYLTDESGVSAAQVYLDGQLLWEGGVVAAPRPLDPEGLLGAAGGRSVTNWRVYTLHATEEGLTVQVGRPLLSTWEILQPFARIAIVLTLVLAPMTAALAWPTVGLALRPLRRLADAAARFEQDVEVPAVPGHDELSQLAQGFTTLLDRLRLERRRERDFLAYAAHELRTPISAIRAGLEAARYRKVPAGAELLDRLYHEALRLETLAGNLLALSRAEAQEIRSAATDLGDLAERAYDRFQPLAVSNGLTLDLEVEPATTWGDSQLIQQALDNLIANALRCTTSGGVTISCGSSDDHAFLCVTDSGPGLPEPIPKGLGLRVVREVVTAHGGDLTFGRGPGAIVTLWFPAPPMTGVDDGTQPRPRPPEDDTR